MTLSKLPPPNVDISTTSLWPSVPVAHASLDTQVREARENILLRILQENRRDMDELKRRLGEIPAATKKRPASRRPADQNLEGSDEDSEDQAYDMSKVSVEEQMIKDELASTATLEQAAILATRIYALKDRSEFKKRSAKSKNAGQVVQGIILNAETGLGEDDRELVSNWTAEAAADAVIVSQKKIRGEATELIQKEIGHNEHSGSRDDSPNSKRRCTSQIQYAKNCAEEEDRDQGSVYREDGV